jgi:hypothetical protein
MNNDKVDEALRACDNAIVLCAGAVSPERWTEHSPRHDDRLRHLRWMVVEASSWSAERLEKKFRWLGFIQGALWADGLCDIDDLKRMNAPQEKP